MTPGPGGDLRDRRRQVRAVIVADCAALILCLTDDARPDGRPATASDGRTP
jgi:hypothetical protein